MSLIGEFNAIECIVKDCKEVAVAKNLCNKHYALQRYRKKHGLPDEIKDLNKKYYRRGK